jgi:hypothetical protein
LFVWYDSDCDDADNDAYKCDYDVDVDGNDDLRTSDMNTNNIHKFWVTVIFMMIRICHVDDESDVDGSRKCNSDSIGEGCSDSDDVSLQMRW